MQIKRRMKATLKTVCHATHIDGGLKRIWHKTSRYRLHIAQQELLWLKEIEAKQKQQQQLFEQQQLLEQQQKQQQRQKKQAYASHILQIAQSIKSLLDHEQGVLVYQYFYLDEQGKACFNGGAERYIRDLAALLLKQGQSTTLVQIGDAQSGEPWQCERDGMKIVGIPCSFHEYADVVEQLPAARLQIYSGYLRFGKLHHPNVMISHGVTWDGVWENADVPALGERLDGIDTLVSVDTNTLSWLRSAFAKKIEEQATELCYVPNYADLSVYTPNPKPKTGEGIHIVFPRRASLERGFWLVAEVLPRILQAFPSVTFDFVGFVHSQDIAQSMHSLAAHSEGRVRCLTAEANEMPGIYQGADISVIPTRCTEGTSLSLIEAMACGNAVVCTNIGGLPNLVVDGFNGLMINPNAEELYQALCRLIKDPALRSSLSKNAVQLAQCFSKAAWENRWMALLDQKLHAPRRTLHAKHHTRVLAVACSLYQGDAYHGYLNALYYAKQNGWMVLAPESYIKRPLAYEGWMFDFHDMQRVTEEERLLVPHLFIPDGLLAEDAQDGRSWTERNLELYSLRNAQLEEALVAQIDAYLAEHTDTDIASFIMYGESYRSLREIAKHYGAKMTSYEFSSVRTYKGFSQTLLFRSSDGKAFYHSDDAQKRYEAFCGEKAQVPLFSRRELIALLYQLPSFPMIPLLEAQTEHEAGVCLGGDLFLSMFSSGKYLDADVLREMVAAYPIHTLPRRLHPAATMSAIERSRISLDPVPFLLSCRRIAAAASNTSFEAMLWNRTAYSRGMNMPFSFRCTQDPRSDEIVEEKFLNWFLFGYAVPGHKALFNEAHFAYLESAPLETDIYLTHQKMVLANLGISEALLALPEEQRFVAILQQRGYSPAAIDLLLQNWENRGSLRPLYEHLQSYVHLLDEQGQVYAKYEGINLKTEDGEIISRFALEEDPRRVRMEFCPLQEGVGFVRMQSVNGAKLASTALHAQGFQCMQQFATVPIVHKQLTQKMVLEIKWSLRELSMENLAHINYKENGSAC